MNTPHGDLVLSDVSIHPSPNVDILRVKFDCELKFEDHVRGIVSRVSQIIVFWGLWNVYLWTPLCYFVAILHLFSQSLSIVLQCGDQLLNVTISFSSARCIQWPGVALIRISYRCVIDVMLLSCVCYTMLIQTRNYCIFSEFPSASTRVRQPKLVWIAAVELPCSQKYFFSSMKIMFSFHVTLRFASLNRG